jgi:hypothetical protein
LWTTGAPGGSDPFDCGLDVRDLEPEQDTVARRPVGIGQTAVVVFHVNSVELQQDLAVADNLLVLIAAVAAPEQRVPAGRSA